MSIVKKIGEGYYGVDASNVVISPESLERIRAMSDYATSLSNKYRRQIGFAPAQKSTDGQERD
jgi:hypothetical protein